MKRAWAWAKLLAAFAWKYAVGAVLCFTLLGSVLVLGWTLRAMRRAALLRWERILPAAPPFEGEGAKVFAACDRWPNWIVDWEARGWRRWTGSLATNAKLGLQGIANTWAVTLPGSVLWFFSWYDGWNNSFHKGYEQYYVGPGLGWLGIGLFIAAMTYLPTAQARQAVTGDWRSFYDFRLVRAVIRRQRLASLGLALAYAAMAWPLMALKTAPLFFDRSPTYATWSDEEVVRVAATFYFACCFLVFPMYVGVRLLAARMYASGVVKAVRAGDVDVAALSAVERGALGRMGLLGRVDREPRPILVAAPLGAMAWAGRAVVLAAIPLVWFLFVAQIYVGEFLNYHGLLG